MAVMMRVKAADGRRDVKNPATGKTISPDTYVEIPVSAASMRLVNNGLLIRDVGSKADPKPKSRTLKARGEHQAKPSAD